MIRKISLFILAFIIFLLLTRCGMWVLREMGPKTVAPLASPSPLQPTTAADTCPVQVQNCLTPHALRVAYGFDSLIQKGFTGKGQTIIDLVSFGSSTLQQDMDIFDQTFDLPPIDLQVISPL